MNQEIPKPLRSALARQAVPADHPSADVLAAFVEHALGEGEKQSVTGHLARCAECREVVFLASEATEPAVTYEPSVAAKPRWWSTSKWAWAVPVAAMFLFGAGYLVLQSYIGAPAEREMASAKVSEKGSWPAYAVAGDGITPARSASGGSLGDGEGGAAQCAGDDRTFPNVATFERQCEGHERPRSSGERDRARKACPAETATSGALNGNRWNDGRRGPGSSAPGQQFCSDRRRN